MPGGLYDRALFLEQRGSATMFVAAPPSVDRPEGVRAEVEQEHQNAKNHLMQMTNVCNQS